MSSENKKAGNPVERRDFLKTVGLAGTAAAVAVPLVATGASEAAAEETWDERVKPRYQETEHVKLFYALNRL